MGAHPLPVARLHVRRLPWRRVPLIVVVAAAVCAADLAWKAAVLAAHHGGYAMDAPTSAAKPLASMLVGAAVLLGALFLPAVCVPGALLVTGGVASNLASLALWQAVPNPVGVHVAGGMLHFNLADVCVVGGGALLAAGLWWTIARIPAERFA